MVVEDGQVSAWTAKLERSRIELARLNEAAAASTSPRLRATLEELAEFRRDSIRRGELHLDLLIRTIALFARHEQLLIVIR